MILSRQIQYVLALIVLGACVPATMAQSPKPVQALKISENHRYFVNADGTPFFWLGDTAWSIFNHPKPADVDLYLADRAAKGFTVIQGCLMLWDGFNRPNPDGQAPFLDRDPAKINEAFFKNVDSVIDKANAKGMTMAILPIWFKTYMQGRQAASFTSETMRAYCKFLGARYRDKPGIIWVIGGDMPGTNVGPLAAEMAKGFREGDGGSHLITYHPTGRQSSSMWFQEAPWLDFCVLQSGHFRETTNFRMIATDWAKTPVKPTLDMEPGYENITDRLIKDNPDAPRIEAGDVRRNGYLAVFAGAAGHTYGCGEVYEFWEKDGGRTLPGWAANLDWRESLKLPGSGQMQYLRWLIESRPMLERIPDQSMIVGDAGARATERIEATRGEDGSYAFIFTSTGKPLTVDLSKMSGESLKGWWYDPRTGAATSIGDVKKSDKAEFAPPTDKGGPDWVLAIDDAAKHYPAPGTHGK